MTKKLPTKIAQERGRRLKECRTAVGLTQRELAKLSGYCAYSYIFRFEHAIRGLSGNAALKFSKILGVRYEYLMAIDDYKTEEDLSKISNE